MGGGQFSGNVERAGKKPERSLGVATLPLGEKPSTFAYFDIREKFLARTSYCGGYDERLVVPFFGAVRIF